MAIALSVRDWTPYQTVEQHEGDRSLECSIVAVLRAGFEQQLGRSTDFLQAIPGVDLWAVTSLFFSWSDTWQFVINSATTIVTFLMVFQNTQNPT